MCNFQYNVLVLTCFFCSTCIYVIAILCHRWFVFVYMQSILQKFTSEGSGELHNLQYFDQEWNCFLDVEDCTSLPDRSRLSCSIFPLHSDISHLPSTSIIDNTSNILNASVLMESVGGIACQSPVYTLSEVSSVISGSSRQPWPLEYKLPSVFPDNVALALEQKVNLNKPQQRYTRGQFLQAIVCNAIRRYTLYPNQVEKTDMARAIVREYPHLLDKSRSGYASWFQSITDSLKNARRPLKHIHEVAKRSRKNKSSIHRDARAASSGSTVQTKCDTPSTITIDHDTLLSLCPSGNSMLGQFVVPTPTASIGQAAGGGRAVSDSLAVGQFVVPTPTVSIGQAAGGDRAVSESLASVGQLVGDMSVSPSVVITSTPKSAQSVMKKRKHDHEDFTINFAPDMAESLDTEQIHKCQQQMLEVMQVDEMHRDAGHLAELMTATFVNRRHLINSRTSIREIRSAYPALFTSHGIIADYSAMVQQPFSRNVLPAFRKKLNVTAGHVMRLTDTVDGKSRSRTAKQLQCKLCHHSQCWLSVVYIVHG